MNSEREFANIFASSMQVTSDLPDWNSSSIHLDVASPTSSPSPPGDGYDSDGERLVPDAELSEDTLQRSRYVVPTEKSTLLCLVFHRREGTSWLTVSVTHLYYTKTYLDPEF